MVFSEDRALKPGFLLFCHKKKSFFYALEVSLIEASTRRSSSWLQKVIDDCFREFGALGKVYTKKDLLETLPLESGETLPFLLQDFQIILLSREVRLITYQLIQQGILSLRSSIWRRSQDQWRMLFHQGTSVKD